MLHALVVTGVNVVLSFLQSSILFHIPFLFGGFEDAVVLPVMLFLVPTVLAFVIGVEFRS